MGRTDERMNSVKVFQGRRRKRKVMRKVEQMSGDERKANNKQTSTRTDARTLAPRFNFSTRNRSTVQQAWLRTLLVLRLSGILHELAQLGAPGTEVILDRMSRRMLPIRVTVSGR